MFSQRKATNVFKTTTCCKVYGCLHISCARKVSTALDGFYQFDPLTFEIDTSTSLYCFVCRTKCFYCDKNHQLSKNNREKHFIQSCTECNKWCYTNANCKGDSLVTLCGACKQITKCNVPSENVSTPPSLSPITTQCDSVMASEIHDAISTFIIGTHTSNLELKHYKKYFNRTLTHLDPELHNVFSLNSINTKHVDGLFLSSHSLMKLLQPETEFRVTEELFNFFIDLFNFYGEYDRSTEKRNDILPDIDFCKT